MKEDIVELYLWAIVMIVGGLGFFLGGLLIKPISVTLMASSPAFFIGGVILLGKADRDRKAEKEEQLIAKMKLDREEIPHDDEDVIVRLCGLHPKRKLKIDQTHNNRTIWE